MRKTNHMGGLAVCAALCAIAAPETAGAQPFGNMQSSSTNERVDGRNLSRVDHEQGWFEQSGGGWTEYGADGRARFRFEETGRDEWSVYLTDRSRNVALQLDVHRRMVTHSANGGPRTDLYPITNMAASRARYSEAARSDSAVRGSFYQQQGRPEVMFQFADTLQCHVQYPSQMIAYGGWNRVRKVPRLAMRGEFTGACGWPNGFFRRVDDPAVYRLYGAGPMKLGRFACHVVDPRQMALFGGFGLVATVEQSSDLFRGREQPTECADP